MMTWQRRGVLAAGVGLAAAKAGSGQEKLSGLFDVAVIGAGVFGAWTAWHLHTAGKRVALIDAYGAGHARSSSGGESRVIRISYGGDPLYSAMAIDSLAQWDTLSRRQTLPILHRTGVLWFSPRNDDYMKKSLAFLQQQKIPHREFNTAQLSAYTQMCFDKGEVGFLEEQTGALMAGRGVQSVVADMPGIARVTENIRGIESDKLGIVQVGRIAAKSAVFACGPWLPKLFPALLTDRITPTRQEVYHFGSKPGDIRFASPALPTWADFNNGNIVYGMPDLEGQGFKIAFDAHGAVVDPDTLDRRVSADGVAQARAYLAKRFPDLAAAPLIHSRVCQYENTSNGDFLIDRHPEFPTVWLVGGGSGHGFKHGPAVGRRVAEHVLDPAKPVEPRFALASKQTVAKRSVY